MIYQTKNSNKTKGIIHKSLKELIEGVLQDEKKIATIVKEVKNMIK